MYAKCAGDWHMDSFVEESIKAIREKVGDGKVLCALSGGVDSSVAAVMLSKAVGNQLTCVFVDHGLLRKNEGDEVEAVFGPEGPYDLNFIRVNAQERFYAKLKGVEEPEKKRKIIGEEVYPCLRRRSKENRCGRLPCTGNHLPGRCRERRRRRIHRYQISP